MEPVAPFTLKLGESQRRTLAPEASETATLDLAANEMVRITAEQKGIDVSLHWFAPGEDRPSLYIDSPNGSTSVEKLVAIASRAGTYRLMVKAGKVEPEKEVPGGYFDVKLEERRLATDRDRKEAELVARFAAAEDLRRTSQSEAALAAYQGLLPLARELNDRNCEGILLYRTGWMERNLERWERSIGPFEQADRIFAEVDDTFLRAMNLNRLGESYRTLFQVEAALAAHRRSFELFEAIQDDDGRVGALLNLGIDQLEAGKLDEAAATLQSGADLAEKLRMLDQEVTARLKLGELLVSRGELAQGRVFLEAAVDKAHAIGRKELEALALLPLGEIDLREERLPAAKERFEHALAVFRERGSIRDAASARLGLGAALLRGKELEAAREQFEKARAIAQADRATNIEAVAAMNMGRYHFARKENALAVAEHEKAISLFERLGDQVGLAANRFGAARSLCQDGRLEAALRQIDDSLGAIEGLRSATANFDLRTTQLANKRDYAELQVEILMQLAKRSPASSFDDRALAATEKARARQLVDLLEEARSSIGKKVPTLIAEGMKRVREDLESFERRRLELYNEESDPALLTRLNDQEGRLLARLDQLKAGARLADPRYSQLEPAKTLDAAGMDQQLQSGDVLLVYWLAEPRSFLWVVSKGHREWFELPPRAEIERLASEFVRLLSTQDPHAPEDSFEVGRALAAKILAPAKRDLAGTRWIVAADGILQRVPFAALPNPASASGSPVVERVEVVSIPSATALAALRSGVRQSYSLDRLAIFADPAFAGDGRSRGALAPLPGTRREAEAIRDLAGDQRQVAVAFGVDANRDAVLGAKLKPNKVLHFATHGSNHPGHPELSGLELSQLDGVGQRIDGTLRLEDIFGMDLDAELVVLSACSTGIGPDVAGEGLASLARGFFYAGAPRLVVSLWPVDDQSTVELMRRFYSHLLRQNQAPAAALRAAQREMRLDPKYGDPYHWAGFVFLGDWRIDAQRWQGPIETKDVGSSPPTGRPPIDLPIPPPDSIAFDEEGSSVRPGGGRP